MPSANVTSASKYAKFSLICGLSIWGAAISLYLWGANWGDNATALVILIIGYIPTAIVAAVACWAGWRAHRAEDLDPESRGAAEFGMIMSITWLLPLLPLIVLLVALLFGWTPRLH
jgi:hypothetical protein